LSGISIAFAIFFGMASKRRNDRKDIEESVEEKTTANTMIMTKLEAMAEDIKDIKRDYKDTQQHVQELHDRVIIVEQSLKSCHKRLDGNTSEK
jgi:septal ring factor EnvC (AmiA/AmiB activator)